MSSRNTYTKTDNNRQVTKPTIYPPIPRSIDDIYVITTPGDRLDLLAYNYYGDVSYWWIIAEANGIGKGSFTIPPGLQLRIPKNINAILTNLQNLNK